MRKSFNMKRPEKTLGDEFDPKAWVSKWETYATALEQQIEMLTPPPPPGKEYWLSPEGIEEARTLWDEEEDVVRIYLEAWLGRKDVILFSHKGEV